MVLQEYFHLREESSELKSSFESERGKGEQNPELFTPKSRKSDIFLALFPVVKQKSLRQDEICRIIA